MPVDDVRSLWQSQPKESMEVRMEEIREREESLEARARKQAMVWYGRAALCFAFAALNLIAGRHPITDRLSGAMFFAWGLGLVRRGGQVRKQLGPRRFAADVVLRTSLEGYRHELEHARDFSPRTGDLLVVALVTGSLVLVKVPGVWANVALLMAISALWAGGMVISRISRRRVRQELDEIESLLKEAE